MFHSECEPLLRVVVSLVSCKQWNSQYLEKIRVAGSVSQEEPK